MIPDDEDTNFETILLNQQLEEGTIEPRLAEFGLDLEMASKVREFQDTRRPSLLLAYLLHRGKAKRYFLKHGDFFAF